MTDPVIPQNGDRGRRDHEQQSETLKADHTLQGVITIPLQPTLPSTAASHDNSNSGSKKPYFHRLSVIAPLLVGVGLIALAAAQLTVYLRQAGIMQSQADISAASERAVINWHSMSVTRGPDYNDFAFKIGNDGNTTPVKPRLIVDCVKRDKEVSEPFDLLIWDESASYQEVIPPKTTIEVAPINIRPHCQIPFADFDNVARGGEHIYFLGEIRYVDSIDHTRPRITQFAKELILDTAMPSPGFGSVISAYSRGQHNCVDRDCPK